MKKILLLVSVFLLVNPLSATIDWTNIKDLGYLGGAVATSVFATAIASSYWQQAALERDKITAQQADKRAKEQIERDEKQKKERAEQSQLEASITFQQLQQEYAQEIDALSQKKGLDKENFFSIIKSKQSATLTRLADYFKELDEHITTLDRNCIHLSNEENTAQRNFLAKLRQIRFKGNLTFNDDKHAEKEEAKRIKHLEEEERLKLEQERLKVKEQKLRIQVQEGKLEAQKNTQQTKLIINAINHKIDTFISTQKNQEQEFAALRRIMSASTDLLKETVGAARAQLAALFVQHFDDAKKQVISAQTQAAPNVVVHQVQPPYNPAAVSIINQRAPSEAVDASAMPASNPPPSFT